MKKKPDEKDIEQETEEKSETSDESKYDKRARAHNSAKTWDTLWTWEGEDSWRGERLDSLYARIETLIPRGSRVVDVGGGVGIFAKRLRDNCDCTVTIWDISPAAVEIARENGFEAKVVDVEDPAQEIRFEDCDVVISTETLEHLSQRGRDRVLAAAANVGKAFFSVPNDWLGPEEEPQHTIQFTAMSFKRQLQKHFGTLRVECEGPCHRPGVPCFLLGVCGFPKPNQPGTDRPFTLSFTMPVRNEEKDIERVLASFRGVADEIVIGVDYRSNDGTREIVAKYADVMFEIDDPQGPEDDRAPQVHFAHIRNRCMNKCTGDWIFMSEGHESLKKGVDVLLQLATAAPKGAKVGYVWRTGQGQRWAFPWLTSGHDRRLRYSRQTHNDLNIPDDVMCVKMPQIETWHFRDHAATEARKAQRKVQNRVTLMDDWMSRESDHSLWHLAAEWREFDPEKAIERYRDFLNSNSKVGDARYQARLVIAKEHATAALKLRIAGDELGFTRRLAEAREILIPATADNWWRTEHWIALGDIAAEQDQWEEALQFYKYSATQINNPPFVLWWIDDCVYSYLPAMRLATAYTELGMTQEALSWARKVVELFPEDIPEELVNEAKSNVSALEEAINE